MVLDASLLNTQHYKVRIKGKVEPSREGVAPSPTSWCSSYRKGSLRVTLDYGCQLYITYLFIFRSEINLYLLYLFIFRSEINSYLLYLFIFRSEINSYLLYLFIPDIGLGVRVFANGPGDLGSIPGRVIPKTQKMVLDASLLSTQHYKVRIKGKVEQSRKSPTHWCSSYRKGSLRVTLDYGCQLYITYLFILHYIFIHI